MDEEIYDTSLIVKKKRKERITMINCARHYYLIYSYNIPVIKLIVHYHITIDVR